MECTIQDEQKMGWTPGGSIGSLCIMLSLLIHWVASRQNVLGNNKFHYFRINNISSSFLSAKIQEEGKDP